MIYFIIIFLLLTLIVSIFLEKRVENPITIFSGIWLLTIFLSSLKLYNMIDYSEKAVRLISIGLIAFIVAAFLCRIISMKKKGHIEKHEKNCNEIINNKFMFILVTVGLIMVLALSIRVIILLKSGTNYNTIRALYYSYGKESLIDNEKIFTIFDWTMSLIISLTIPTIIVGIINKKVNKILIIESMVMIILYVFSTTGRMPLILIVIQLVLEMLLNKEKLNENVKKISKIVIVLMTICILSLTIIRSSNQKNDKVNSIYAYFSLPLPYFSQMIDVIDKQEVNTNGVATAYGPYLLVQKTVKMITGYKFSNSEDLAKKVTKPQTYWVRIFMDSTDYYNAYATMFYNFYLDYKEIGIIVFSFIYGIIVERIYISAISKKTMKINIVYLIIITGLIQSFAIWQFSSPTILIALVLINLLIKKEKINSGKNINIWND